MKYTTIDGIELGQFNEIMNDLGYYDEVVFHMGELDELFHRDASGAVRSAFYGERFGYIQDSFNPNDDFFTFNVYGNLVSILEFYLQEYFDQFENEILEYVNDNEIELYGVEEDDEDGYFYSGCGYLSELFEKTIDK